MLLKKYIGDKKFYRMVLAIAVPVMIQNGITNFVNLLDNIMVGSLGTEAMSGVSIVNQFTFIYNLMVFGAVAAAGIFTAQYHGSEDLDGIRYTVRFKLLTCLVAGTLGVLLFARFGGSFIDLFLHTSDSQGDLALTHALGMEYLYVMLIGLLPYALSQVYASTMRETGQTVIPMLGSFVAVITNFVLNLILIFGLLGFPALGVTGAALATSISRVAELLFLVLYAHLKKDKFPYIRHLYRSLYIPRKLALRICIKGLPLMLNEILWAVSITLRNQCFSVRGLDAVAAMNIATTLQNVLNVVYIALGSAISIIVGRLLGAGELDKARDTARKMIAFTIFAASLVGVLCVGLSFLFPRIYNTSPAIRDLATYMIIVAALMLPFSSYCFSAYYTLRSGGRVLTTIIFDSVFMWVLVLPLCVVLAYLTDLDVRVIYAVSYLTEVVKAIFGALLLRGGSWVRRLVGNEEKSV